MEGGVYIEEALQDVLKETDLVNFERKLCVELQLSRLEHFDHVTDDELKAFTGLSQPAIRRLRVAIAEKKKKMKKSKGIFSTIGKKESREITKVLVPAMDVNVLTLPESNGTCLIIKDEIKLMERLGEGSFAVVKRAIWSPKTGRKLDVAVKILRKSTPEIIEDLQREVTNMQKLQHPNLIQLYGIVFSNPAMMVVEFCDGGALIDRLRSTEKPVLLVSMLTDYAQQIAKGMAYLESKHCVHRDLAARNVLLTNNERVAKICDFGLMRVLENNERLYVMSAQKKVPFAWCPPESLRYRQFSHASDVWSFGVTLWELFSYGEEPWIGLRGAEVLTKLEAGERLPRPQRCSDELYDLISTCWSLKADLRPKFSLLKGILSEIMFMIAECREPSTSSNDVDLELVVNDRVIVIHASGLIWYGQNMRTRKFGSFFRSSVHLRSERSPTKGEQLMNPLQPRNGDPANISKPVPGSFIHAGHGDINPEQSWGQPDYIDDIYLRNPILRKEEFANGNKQKRFGPEIIPNLTDLQPPLYRLNPGQSNAANGGDPYIDPFAPFSVYSFDALSEAESYQPAGGTTKLLSSTLPTNVYDQPPLPSIYSQDLSHPPSLANPSQSASTSGLTASGGTSNGTAVMGRATQPVIGIQNKTNSLQYSSLPRPMRLAPDTPSCSSQLHRTSYSGADITPHSPLQQSLTAAQSASASHLPSTSWEHFQSSYGVQNEQDATRTDTTLHRASSYLTATARGNYQATVSNSSMQNGKVPPPRPKPPNFKQTVQNNTHWGATPAVPSNTSNAYPTSATVVQTRPSTSTPSGILVATSSHSQDSPDPFEVSKAVKDIASRGRYSQLFKDHPAAPAKETTEQIGLNLPYSNRLQPPSSLSLYNDRSPSTSQTLATSLGFTEHRPGIGTCYYWQPGHAKFSVPEQHTLSSSFGSTPALLYDAQLGASSKLGNPVANGISIRPRRASNHPVANSSRQRNSYLSDEVLGMFDPLVAERDALQNARSVSTSSSSAATAAAAAVRPSSDPVDIVLSKATFADRQRCAIKLQRCCNDIEKAVNELKIEELLTMGVARDRGEAISALQDCRWDLNAAAAALIS